MSGNRTKLENIFIEALSIESPEDRTQFLDEQCGDNLELRSQVEELLAANSEMSQFLDQTRAMEPQPFNPLPIGSTIGKYKLMEQIGQGGMGVVYVARQEVPVKRDVALKIIRPGMDTNEVLARFEQERQALAMMDHPNIAKVLDAGATDNGRPYFVMELVRGIKITDFCDQKRLSNRNRLNLFTDVCQAIQHAHQKGIIHRDIKPENILVASYDGKPIAKVIDFGIAKAVTEKLADRTVYTQFNQFIGTPMYMSPEQAALSGIDIDTRTDIYSLGVLLYELLTGSTPFDKSKFLQAALEEIRRIIREEQPQRPSKRVSQLGTSATGISENRSTSNRRLSQSLHRDIDWIVMKALEKDRDRRYETANGFAMDIKRFLNCEPVLAGPPSLIYQLEKFSKRNAKWIASLAAIGLVIAAFVLWSVRSDRKLRAEGQVNTLLTAEINSVPDVVQQIDSLRSWTDPKLRFTFDDSESTRDQRLRAAIALADVDSTKSKFLLDQLKTCSSDEFQVICNAIHSVDEAVIQELAQNATDENNAKALRFNTFCALAAFAPDHEIWNSNDHCEFVTNELVQVLPSQLNAWRDSLAPVKNKLIPHLTDVYSDESRSAESRLFATVTLAVYGQDNPDQLFEWVCLANQKQFDLIFQKLEKHGKAAERSAREQLKLQVAKNLSEKEKDAHAMRQANAAICLIRLNRTDDVWPILKHSSDPRIRSFIVNWAAALECDPDIFVDRYYEETDTSIKRAIVQVLGEYQKSDFSPGALDRLLDDVFKTMKTTPDPGLHSCARWLLGRFDRQKESQAAINELSDNLKFDLAKRNWSVNSQGHVFVAFDAKETLMGSPESEPERIFHEYSHQRKVNRKFAIATTEITREEWKRFISDPKDPLSPESDFVVKYSPTWDSPMSSITWFNVASYCNWLSELEGIPEDQWCFEPNEDGQYNHGTRLKENFLELTGYRPPTESEWEHMARAGAVTSRFFGENVKLLEKYAWFQPNSQGRMWTIALKKPNDFGMFDVYGNAYEWCVGQFEMWLDDQSQPAPPEDDSYINTGPVNASHRIAIRGGSWSMPSLNARSAYRNGIQPDRAPNVMGFRLAKSIITEE